MEPYRTVVQIGVLTGMRIGEIFALGWKRVDLLRGTLGIGLARTNYVTRSVLGFHGGRLTLFRSKIKLGIR